uniref:Zinc finger and BTB domain containing 10 n=1 Tax=Tetraodon nigroviridis TaxID=99883 RepID=H3DK90_TETNG
AGSGGGQGSWGQRNIPERQHGTRGGGRRGPGRGQRASRRGRLPERPGNRPNSVDVRGSGSAAETGSRKSGVEMRPQMSLLKHSQFHASWLQEFPWLKFCQETGLMSCSWCHNFATKNSDELVKGSRNYKRALLLRHHLSPEHGRNDPTKQRGVILSQANSSASTSAERRPGPDRGQEMVRPSDSASPSANCSGEDYRSKPNENSYCYQLLQELDKQRKSGILCDVNIVVSGQVFRAHKNILVAGSRYFKTLYCLTKSEAQDQATVTHLDIAAVQGFSVILDFLYSGNLLLTSQNAIEVMSVASYLQMTEVVHSCRAFIKDALNISIKQEAPDSVVVDYNKRQTVAKEGHRGAEHKSSTFWATSILSKLSIKAGGHQGREAAAEEEDEACGVNWSHHNDNSSDSAETNEARAARGQFFVWNREAPDAAAGSGRRKKQATTRRFVYNFPPEPEEGFGEGMFIQPSASYPREDFSSLSENAGRSGLLPALLLVPFLEFHLSGIVSREPASAATSALDQRGRADPSSKSPRLSTTSRFSLSLSPSLLAPPLPVPFPELANQIPCSIIQDIQQGESWENGEASAPINKLKCPHCNYIAKHRRTLKRHLIIHSGVRSFSCDICGKLFTRREHVKRHSLRKVHKKDKKYKCMVCKKIFMLAASVGIRHGSRRYGVCADCADSHQATQEGLEGLEFPRDEDFEGEDVEDLEGEEPNDNDQSNWGPKWTPGLGLFIFG